jgi:membrane protease YdiL (CAAX protease family)
MGSQKKRSSWSDYSTPANIAALFLSLQFLTEFPVAFLLYLVQLTEDILMNRLIVLLISQIICTAILIFIIIPFLEVKDIQFEPITYTSSLTFVAVFCIFWAILIPITLGNLVIHNILDVEVDILKNPIPLPTGQSENIFSIIIWLIAGTLGVAICMEYLYRGILIPLLENRGISPFNTVLISSSVFAFVNIPFNLGFQVTFLGESNLINVYLSRYDLFHSLFYSLNLFITTFLLGMACGIVYILTRNIVYPIMIHCLETIPYYLLKLFNTNEIIMAILGLLIIVINIAGLFIIIYLIYSLFTSSSQPEWITILNKKSVIDIRRGLVGFYVIFVVIIFYLVVFLGLLAEHAPIIVTVVFHVVFLGFCFKNMREDKLRLRISRDHLELKGGTDEQ